MLAEYFLAFVLFKTVRSDIIKPVDLSHHFDQNTHYWTGSSPFHFTKIGEGITSEGFWLASNDFEAGEHGGTHMDAPYHFYRDGWKLGEIPFERFYGEEITTMRDRWYGENHVALKREDQSTNYEVNMWDYYTYPICHIVGVVIYAADEASENPDYLLGLDKLVEWEEQNGPIPDNSIILINYGWADKYSNWTEYFGSPEMNVSTFHFPGLSEEVAEWIVHSGRVFGVGSDTPSIDAGQSKDFKAHQVLSKNNIYILENVALNGTDLPEKDFNLFALPMKIRYGTGAPCRIVALPRREALVV